MTVQKKLADWLTIFKGGQQGEQSLTGSRGSSAKTHTMMQMEDLMKEIIEFKHIAESCKGTDPAEHKMQEVAAVLEQLREAMTGTESKVCHKQVCAQTVIVG